MYWVTANVPAVQTFGAAGYPQVYTVNQPYQNTCAPVTTIVPMTTIAWPSTGVGTWPWQPPTVPVPHYGWLCPGCGQGYAPGIIQCWNCVPKQEAEGSPDGDVQ